MQIMAGLGKLHLSKRIVWLLAFCMLGLIIFYQAILPRNTADAYLTRLDVSAEKLQEKFTALAAGVDKDVFNNPYVDDTQISQDIAELHTLLEESRTELEAFKSDAHGLPVLVFTGYLGRYQQAVVSREESQAIAAQSADVISQYEPIVHYLDVYWQQQHEFHSKLDAFNSIADLNTIVNQGDTYRAYVVACNKMASTMEATEAPPGFAEFNANSVETYRQAAKGFEALAAGADLARDDIIYSAARAIEDATRKNDLADKQLYIRTIREATALGEVARLPEKVASLLGE